MSQWEVYRHTKRGTTYTVLTKAMLACSLSAQEADDKSCIVYLNQDGYPLVIPEAQFVDDGTVMRVTTLTLQSNDPDGLLVGDVLLIYLGQNGSMWGRAHREFHDGRFERLL